MILAAPAASSTDPDPAQAQGGWLDAPDLQVFVFGLFFIFGGITSLNDVIIPKLKALFTLSYAEAMLVQSAFFGAYLLVSLPGAALVQRVGYMRAACVGLLMMMAGCLLFVPASASALFPMFLLALFILAAGITVVQVVANPLISLLGHPQTAHSRLTFAQAFNSVGTTIFPYVGALLILGAATVVNPATLSGDALQAFRAETTGVIVRAYLVLAAALAVVAAVVWSRRQRLPDAGKAPVRWLASFDLLRQPRFAFGAACIFLYVGAEVAVGSMVVNYLEQADTMALGPQAAGQHVPIYWGLAMVGRFVGAGFLRVVSPGRVLAGAAVAVLLLLLAASQTTGAVSGWALLAVGLFNSIMFPTIFALASEGLGERAAEGSGIICMAIVGGAVVPLLTGAFADAAGLRLALTVPAVCYAAILAFGVTAASARHSPSASAARRA